MKQPTTSKNKRKRPTGVSSIPMVRTHRGFWIGTPNGHDVHILGNSKMPARTRKALVEMIDAAAKAAADGTLEVSPNDKLTHSPST